MEVRIIRQLLQYKVGDISARDFEFCRLVGVWKAVLVLAGAIPVREGSRTDNYPVQVALLNIVLLKYMICEHGT